MAAVSFAPWSPSESDPFDRRKAAHLLRRTGFGASAAEIERALDQGLEATVEDLFADPSEEDAEFQSVRDCVAGSLLDVDDVGQTQAWWVHRMVRTQRPLREKLTLFWHGHFATSYMKVESARLMQQQVDTLRGLAWGDFRELVLAMAKDPAMLVWLDGESNSKEHPNENFARELMELFTCGIGNYSEQDVLEGARAFTGWHREENSFAFMPINTMEGEKRFLGKTGRFDGGDIVEILMQHPATPRFMAHKLLRFFAAGEPADEAVEEGAALLDRTQLNIKWFLRDLFLSQYFFSDACYRKRIASPAEYVVGAVRTLNIRVSANELRDRMKEMGQELLAPPNVKGWDGEEKWINSSTWPTRLAFAEQVSQLSSDAPYGQNLPLKELISPDLNEPPQVVNALSELLMLGDLAEGVRADLAQFLVATDDGPNPDQYRDDPGVRSERNRAALATVLGLPEYHAY